MIRSFVFSSVFAAAVACTLLSAPQASARALGGFSINTSGPITRTPWDPWGGVQLCTAPLRKANSATPGGWDYQMASGYNYGGCLADAGHWASLGYSFNPNPGIGYCACHSGFNGMIVIGPSGNGPLGEQSLTPEQVQRFDDGMQQLRQKYQFDKFLEESQQLLDSITAPAAPDGQ
jgi:hypothetical protein